MPQISIAMIVRDEEKNLERALKSIQPLKAELVIVDTGSVDNTVEIAKKYTKHVHFKEWTSNFSFHRNHSFGLCTGKWILGFDADEEFFLNCSLKKFHSILKAVPNHINTLSMVVQDMRQGKKISEVDSARFFRKGSTIWTGAIHNKPIYDGPTAPLGIVCHLKHYGYDLKPEQAKKKSDRTITALLKVLEETPDDYESMFYLSQAYAVYDDNEDETLRWGERYIEKREQVENFNPSIYYTILGIYIRRKELDKATAMVGEAMTHYKGNPDIYWRNLQIAIEINDQHMLANSAQMFVLAIDNVESYRIKNHGGFLFTNRPEFMVQALYYLSMAHYQKGQHAVGRILEMSKDFPNNIKEQVKDTVLTGMKQFGVESNLIQTKRIITASGVNYANLN